MSVTFQESTPSRSGVLQNIRPPLFVVEIAYAEGIEELATSSKNACGDPSQLVVFHPSETDFHTRLEVCFAISTCKRRNIAGLPGARSYFVQFEEGMHFVFDNVENKNLRRRLRFVLAVKF